MNLLNCGPHPFILKSTHDFSSRPLSQTSRVRDGLRRGMNGSSGKVCVHLIVARLLFVMSPHFTGNFSSALRISKQLFLFVRFTQDQGHYRSLSAKPYRLLMCTPDSGFTGRQIIRRSSPNGIQVNLVILIAKPVCRSHGCRAIEGLRLFSSLHGMLPRLGLP